MKTIGILTGGGDVPGLNPAIRQLTIEATRAGYRVLGIRRGWAGLVDLLREGDPARATEGEHVTVLEPALVDRAGRTGGTLLHTSRTKPSKVPRAAVPAHLADGYDDDINDLTPEVIANLEWLGIDALVPIGGDDTLSYGVRLHEEGVPVVAIPKTMDNDVPGTEYCIGFGTCVARTIEMLAALRTTAGSHERFLVVEVFGRYAGFTALLPTMAGAADRCLIPEHPFDVERLCELLSEDRRAKPSRYSVVLVSEGAAPAGGEMVFEGEEADMFGHKKLGGIGDQVAAALKRLSPRYNNGETVKIVNQRLSYLVRCGDPSALDCIVPTAYGRVAFDLIARGQSGRLVALRDGRYTDVPLEAVTSRKKVVDVERSYDGERLRPRFDSPAGLGLLMLAGEPSA